MFEFDLPTHQKSIIKVIGVGGGGNNAVGHMFNQGIKDVEFIVANTDAQALKSNPIPNKLQLGIGLTEGLGAGANPQVGQKAAVESKEEIRELLSPNTKMVFITAGMGGGTGTGAAPVIAGIAKDLDILTVGIVTSPFSFEGKRKMTAAEEGIAQLRANCDTVLVISNDKLREIHGNLSIRNAFSEADDVLTTAAKSIAEIITVTSEVNVDFQDVRTVMKDSGPAVMGSAEMDGQDRAIRAVESALSSPLLDNTDIKGAKKILLSITYGEEAELTMDELTEITDYIEEKAGYEAEVIFGQGLDSTLEDKVRVTLIATGFAEKELGQEDVRKVYDLESTKIISEEKPEAPAPRVETPAPSFTPPTPEPQATEESSISAEDKVVHQLDFNNDSQEGSVANTDTVEPHNAAEGYSDTPLFQFSGSKYEVTNVQEEEQSVSSRSEEEINVELQELEHKRQLLIQQSQERIKRLKELSSEQSADLQNFKEKLDVPAYQRRNIRLNNDVPHSSEENVSRYNLNDDNDILGNNKFLHDNVD